MPNNPFEYLEIVKKHFQKLMTIPFIRGGWLVKIFGKKKEATQQSVQRTR
jgi:hypothetical protein